jgi:hypothetical protein
MRALLLALVAPIMVSIAACTPLIGPGFDDYVAQPTTCDLLAPTTADPREHVVCTEGQTCAPVTASGTSSSTERSCVTARDTRPELAACEYANDCAAGSFCSGGGECLAYCRLDAPTCAGGGPCVAFPDAPVSNGAETLGFCGPPACTPLAGGCDGKCDFYTPDRAGCFPARGVAKRGAACAFDEDCAADFVCGRENVCTRYCRMGAGADDCGGAACEAIDGEELVLDGVRFGYCASK